MLSFLCNYCEREDMFQQVPNVTLTISNILYFPNLLFYWAVTVERRDEQERRGMPQSKQTCPKMSYRDEASSFLCDVGSEQASGRGLG